MNLISRIEKIIRDQYFNHHEPERKLPKSYYITYSGIVQVYIRDNGVCNFNGQMFRTLTLSNINVEEQYRDQGIGSIILDTLIYICPYSVFTAECVHSPVLKDMLLKRGFIEDPNLARNFYLFIN